MGSVLKPFSGLLSPNKYQVPTSHRMEVDWGHPLSNGLIGCWVPGITYGVDISRQVVPALSLGANLKFASTIEGPCSWSDNAAGNDILNGTATAPFKSLNNASGGFTIYWRGSISAQITNASNPLICGITYDIAATSPFIVAAIAPISGGQYPGISIYWNSNAILSHLDVTGIVNNFNTMYSFGATFVIGGSAIFYNNGVSAGTGSIGSAVASVSANSQIAIGGDTWSATTSHSQTNIAIFWNRALGADEMMAVNLSPYDVLVPSESQLPILSTGGGAVKFRRTRFELGTRVGSRQAA